MSNITIFREIILKQIITEEGKETSRKELREQLVALNNQQLEFEDKKKKTLTEFSLKGADGAQLDRIRQKFDAEASDFHVRRDELRMNMDALEELVVGEEVVIGSVEGPYDLKVGDTLDGAVNAEIILKDGVVVEIRQ
ncbi:YlqD family protein [Desulfitobacterium sp. PCE1]|uniref:YlqD family protein n=1 Tax=Desulfitobacterium sp. PCE1 TaxID=146907 RepID=UPI00037B28FE|nr:YlqD family protein [Desulfitobacterium sp. PCE1]